MEGIPVATIMIYNTMLPLKFSCLLLFSLFIHICFSFSLLCTFYGHLILPIRFLKATDKIFFSNMIAFKMSPWYVSDFAVTSYVTFMKSLIASPQDSMELREKGILYTNLASDEKVVHLFREFDTMGLYLDFFDNVKMGIKDNCNHKSKTWIAKLINIGFRTVVALVVRSVLLVSTLQTCCVFRAAWSS